ncbi:MAG: hypothetical protein JNK02_15400 [Planctomycetes bacterium]|nr:hypothetical protein [Planctomycetota bacterium]
MRRTPPPRPPRRSRAAALAALVLVCGACVTPDVQVWNLDQLHDETSRHRYQAALQSDFGWFMRRGVLGLFQSSAADWAAEVDKERVEDPAGECLANLILLEERAAALEEIDPRHLEWFARVAAEDPSRLSRERAVLALARLAEGLSPGLPQRLGADQRPAGPDELAPVLEGLVRATRRVVSNDPEAAADLSASVAAVRALDLDLAAARRALRAASELERLAKGRQASAAELDALVAHLASLLVRRALAVALEDEDDFVRAAAVRGVAATGGARALDVVLYDRLRKETATRPLRAILEVVAERGLPAADPANAAALKRRDEWIAALQVVATQHPEGELRVRAMRTLRAVAAPDLASLREEDWQAWWAARRAPRPEERAP